MLYGGFSGSERLDSIERYDGQAWSILDVRLPQPATNFLVACIDRSSVIISGGYNRDSSEHLDRSFILNVETGELSDSTPYPYLGYIPTSNSSVHD